MRKSINTKIAQVVLLSFGFMEKLVAGRPAPPVPNPKKGPPTLPPGTPIDDFLVLLTIIAILTAFYFLKYNHKKSS
ncbi:hypothetical protein [Flavobacterium sp.]|uniref:hypothetical protein n=1 Tax=Flavobacterium sp. TaxID=239 RepID=UPI003D10C805